MKHNDYYKRQFYACLLAFYAVCFLMVFLGWSHLLGGWEAVTASGIVGMAVFLVLWIIERSRD